MTPFLADPPTPQRFFRRPASAFRAASSSGTPETVVTALPRRPAVSRRTFTRPPACVAGGRSRALRRSPSLVDQTSCRSRAGMARDASERPREKAGALRFAAHLAGALDEQEGDLAGRAERVGDQRVVVHRDG